MLPDVPGFAGEFAGEHATRGSRRAAMREVQLRGGQAGGRGQVRMRLGDPTR